MSQSFTKQTLNAVLYAYPYQQYADDDNVRAFFDAYNTLVQRYVDSFNTIDLSIYTESQIQLELLDWVGTNIYGQIRPVLSESMSWTDGLYGVLYYGDMVPLGEIVLNTISSYTTISDDIYKRIITWNFFRGDGPYFSVKWLKRRIMRFLLGTAGTEPNIGTTYDISVTFSGLNTVDVSIPSSYSAAALLKEAMDDRVVLLPFMKIFVVTLV